MKVFGASAVMKKLINHFRPKKLGPLGRPGNSSQENDPDFWTTPLETVDLEIPLFRCAVRFLGWGARRFVVVCGRAPPSPFLQYSVGSWVNGA